MANGAHGLMKIKKCKNCGRVLSDRKQRNTGGVLYCSDSCQRMYNTLRKTKLIRAYNVEIKELENRMVKLAEAMDTLAHYSEQLIEQYKDYVILKESVAGQDTPYKQDMNI